MCHYNLLVFPALVLPLTGILKMDLAQVLQLSFLQYLLFGVSALPWGIAADRLGGRPLMILMFLGAGMFFIVAKLEVWLCPWHVAMREKGSQASTVNLIDER